MIKTKAGMADDYLKNLAQIYKAVNDEAKKQGIIMDYKILLGNDSTPQDFEIFLCRNLKIWPLSMVCASKTDPIARKLIGSEDVRRQGAVKRMEIRDIMGNKLMREITLK